MATAQRLCILVIMVISIKGQGYQDNGLQKQGQGQFGQTNSPNQGQGAQQGGQDTQNGGQGQNQGSYGNNFGNPPFNPNVMPTNDYCTYNRQSSPMNNYFVGYRTGETQFGTSGTCQCKIKSVFDTYVTLETYLDDPNFQAKREGSKCGPLMFIDSHGTDHYVCPAYMSHQNAAHKTVYKVRRNDVLSFEVFNPDNLKLQNFVRVSSSGQSSLTIVCKQSNQRTLTVCPCHSKNSGGTFGNYTRAVADRVGLIVGLCILAILLAAAVIVAVIFIRRHKQAEKESI